MVVCIHPVYIVWPEWKKGAPYFASAFSLLAVCNDVPKEGQRKRAEAVSSVQCRAFHSLSFHDERPCHRFECFARLANIGSEKRKKKDKGKGRANRLGKQNGEHEPAKIAWYGQRLGHRAVRESFGLFREYISWFA